MFSFFKFPFYAVFEWAWIKKNDEKSKMQFLSLMTETSFLLRAGDSGSKWFVCVCVYVGLCLTLCVGNSFGRVEDAGTWVF